MKIDPQKLDEFCSKIHALIAASPAREVEKNLRALLGVLFNNLDLVTREQFDNQNERLARAEEQLSALESRIKALEGAGKTE